MIVMSRILLPDTALCDSPIHRHVVVCRMEDIPTIKEQHFRRDQPHLWMAREGFYNCRKPATIHFRIVVEQHLDLAVGSTEARIARAGKAAILIEHQRLNRWVACQYLQ